MQGGCYFFKIFDSTNNKNTCSKGFQRLPWNRPWRGEKLRVKLGVSAAITSSGMGKNPSTATQCKHFDVQHTGSRYSSGEGGEMPALGCLFAAGPVAKHKCTIKGLWGPCILHPSTVQRFIVSPCQACCSFLGQFSVPDQFTLYHGTEQCCVNE